jgi:hypothetical protein
LEKAKNHQENKYGEPWLMEDATAAWEGEGGAMAPAEKQLIGTVNQVAWAEQIKANVTAEFDRVARALEWRAGGQSEQHRSDTRAVIAILEEKRAEVMAKDQAGYFIHEWQELRDQGADHDHPWSPLQSNPGQSDGGCWLDGDILRQKEKKHAGLTALARLCAPGRTQVAASSSDARSFQAPSFQIERTRSQ